jgi:hypothetical protein
MNDLASLPDGVDEAIGLVDGLDEALMHGFARLGDEHRARLDGLAATFAGTPLGPAVAEAVAAVDRGEFLARSFLGLASARVALLGAAHDALVARAREALGRPPVAATEELPARPPEGWAPALASVQHWLTELAIAGLRNLEESAVAPFSATLAVLREAPDLTGLTALLTGFSSELVRSIPAGGREVPAFRWGDLWSAAMVRSQNLPSSPTFRPAEGTLTSLGLDVRSHDQFLCAVLYGLFEEEGGEARTVRVPFSGYKVGAISGTETWDLFGAVADPVLAALGAHKALMIDGAELRADGDLILREPPRVGGRADPFAVADRLTSLPPPPALLRHPVHVAEVARLPRGHGLPAATERLPADSELNEAAVSAADELIGLLRFDRGGWRVQPLCYRSGTGWAMAGEDLAGRRKKLKDRPLDVLKERAGRLLRARS